MKCGAFAASAAALSASSRVAFAASAAALAASSRRGLPTGSDAPSAATFCRLAPTALASSSLFLLGEHLLQLLVLLGIRIHAVPFLRGCTATLSTEAPIIRRGRNVGLVS